MNIRSDEMEAITIGAMLFDINVLNKIKEKLRASNFLSVYYQDIFLRILDLAESEKSKEIIPIDLLLFQYHELPRNRTALMYCVKKYVAYINENVKQEAVKCFWEYVEVIATNTDPIFKEIQETK